MKYNQVINYDKAPIFSRGIAFMIDWYVGGVLVYFPVILIINKINLGKEYTLDLRSLPFSMAVIAVSLAFIIALLYYVLIPYLLNGQTLGKKIVKLKICELNKEKISFFSLIKRQVFGIMLIEGSLFLITPLLWQAIFYKAALYQQILTWIYYVLSVASILMIIFSKNKKAIHDYIGNTYVIVK